MSIASRVLNVVRLINKRGAYSRETSAETQLLLSGKMLAESTKIKKQLRSLHEVEFKVFSQFGDDGIIQWLTNNLDIPNKTFIEFGVEDYRESNTRFLLMNDNWSGVVIDGSQDNVSSIMNSNIYWRYELTAKAAFIDRENINVLLAGSSMDPDVGVLHIDLDGNDYWILEAINVVVPIVIIVEYNCVFGIERALTVPYDRTFRRTKAHYSNLYWGASLPAFHRLCAGRGYAFIGCNSAGNNAYFVREDKLNAVVRAVPLVEGFVVSKFRDSRDRKGNLTYVTGGERSAAIRGMPVFNLESNRIEEL